MKPLSVIGCVVVALTIGTVFGRWTARLETPAPVAAVNPTVMAAPSMGFLPNRNREAAENGPPVTVTGVVREVIQVPTYTYLRVDREGGEEVWAAVPSSPEMAAGAKVSIADAHVMHDFSSKTLGRTFAQIYFGRLPEQGARGL